MFRYLDYVPIWCLQTLFVEFITSFECYFKAMSCFCFIFLYCLVLFLMTAHRENARAVTGDLPTTTSLHIHTFQCFTFQYCQNCWHFSELWLMLHYQKTTSSFMAVQHNCWFNVMKKKGFPGKEKCSFMWVKLKYLKDLISENIHVHSFVYLPLPGLAFSSLSE